MIHSNDVRLSGSVEVLSSETSAHTKDFEMKNKNYTLLMMGAPRDQGIVILSLMICCGCDIVNYLLGSQISIIMYISCI